MVDLETALARILSEIPSARTETVSLADGHARVLSEEVRSPIDLPGFDNSAMDGYAVRSEDVFGARPESPARLRLATTIAAGQCWGGEVERGTCVRLFTGSPMPRGADCVVMQEDTRVAPGAESEVQILSPSKPGESVRFQGEDVKRGAVLTEAGEKLTAGRISLLAAAGVTRVQVGRRPAVGLLATGSELREPGESLGPGQIYESNRTGLATLIRGAGAVPRVFPLVADTLSATKAALVEAFAGCEAVVTSGGVSVGEFDFIKRALEEVGGGVDYWRVAIKPGRPFVFGRCGEKFLFGLPGNPVSAMVTFLLLVRPALLRWQGAAEVSLPSHPGVLAERLVNRGERRHFMRVKVDGSGNVVSAGLQASHALSSLAGANGLVDVPPQTELGAGTTVKVLRWE